MAKTVNIEQEKEMGKRENSVVVNNEHKQLKIHSLRFDRVQLMIDDKYKLRQEGDAFYIVKRQPQYPKTYEECCEILSTHSYTHILGHKGDLVGGFQRLLICRDAYWKMAGDWKPDWSDNHVFKFCIGAYFNNIEIFASAITNHVLAFPTEEMRDAFYENFKDLIEECKELL